MARMLRIQFPGAIYHVVNRGNRREVIFRDDADRESFLRTLGEVCAKTGWQMHAFCLMPDHFHFVLETPQANLTAGMKWFLGTFTARFNRRHQLNGHLFAGRFKALLIGGSGGFLRTVCDYVHLNPVRARLIAADSPVRTFRWSSLGAYLEPGERRPAWLRTDRLLGECGIERDDAAGLRHFEDRLEARRGQELGEEFAAVRRGWCLGSEVFRQEMLVHVASDSGKRKDRSGPPEREAAEVEANRIVDQELQRALWTEAELLCRRKGDREKIAIALRLRAETTVTLEWIARRLHMGTRQHLNHLLYWQRRGQRDGATPRDRKRGAPVVPSGGSPGTVTQGPSQVSASASVSASPSTASPRPRRNRSVIRSRSAPKVAPDVRPPAASEQVMPIESGYSTTILLNDPSGFDVRFD